MLELQAKLRRTIIFVSHDLDEAFKLGNRIALMEGGRIVQCGTPQEIIANPADDYVEDFVAHMNPLLVLRAMDIMAPPIGNGENAVPADSSLAAVIEQLSAGASSVCVRGADGQLVGSIFSHNVVAALRRKPARDNAGVH